MCSEEDGQGVDVPVGIAGDSTGVPEEVSGEVIPESLLCILDRFGLFVDEIGRSGSIGNGKESCHLLRLGDLSLGSVVP